MFSFSPMTYLCGIHYHPQLLVLDLYITSDILAVSAKIHDKPDNFNFEIVNFPFFDGDVPCSPFGLQQSRFLSGADRECYTGSLLSLLVHPPFR